MKAEQIIDEMQASLMKLRKHFRLTGTTRESRCHHVFTYCSLCYPRTTGECKCYFDVNNPIGTERFRIIHKDCPIHGECTCPRWLQKEGGIAFTCPIHGECYGGWYHDKSDCTHSERCRLHPKGECICKRPDVMPYPLCPVHGRGFKESPTVPGTIEEATPDLPAGVKTFTARGIMDDLRGTPDLPLHARVAKALGHDVALVRGDYQMDSRKEFERSGRPWIDIPDFPNDLVAAMGALEEYMSANKTHTNFYVDYRGFGYISIGGEMIRYENGLNAQAICEAIVAHAEQQ